MTPAFDFGPNRGPATVTARTSTGFPSSPITILVFFGFGPDLFFMGLPESAGILLAIGLDGGGELCIEFETEARFGAIRSRSR